MRKSVYLLILIVFCFLWTSCSSDSPGIDPPATVHVGNSEIVLDDSNTYTISFSASEDWTVSVVDTSKTGWCQVFPISGKAGDGQVQVTASPNSSLNDRSVYVVIKAGDAEAQVSVLQKMGTGLANIPITDRDFRLYCIENFDLDNDGLVSFREVEKVEKINLSSKWDIRSLGGIEYFRSLKTLVIPSYSSSLVSIDVSKNTELEYLEVEGSGLTTLDLSNNKKLVYLNCGRNYKLRNLDLSNNSELVTLKCSSSDFSNLNVSNLPKLEELICTYSNLTTLDVSKNVNLKTLDCSDNSLSALNISANVNLERVDCSWNSIAALDLLKNTKLTYVNCSYNRLTTLNVSRNAALKSLYCYNSTMTELSVNVNQMDSSNSLYISKHSNTKISLVFIVERK